MMPLEAMLRRREAELEQGAGLMRLESVLQPAGVVLPWEEALAEVVLRFRRVMGREAQKDPWAPASSPPAAVAVVVLAFFLFAEVETRLAALMDLPRTGTDVRKSPGVGKADLRCVRLYEGLD